MNRHTANYKLILYKNNKKNEYNRRFFYTQNDALTYLDNNNPTYEFPKNTVKNIRQRFTVNRKKDYYVLAKVERGKYGNITNEIIVDYFEKQKEETFKNNLCGKKANYSELLEKLKYLKKYFVFVLDNKLLFWNLEKLYYIMCNNTDEAKKMYLCLKRDNERLDFKHIITHRKEKKIFYALLLEVTGFKFMKNLTTKRL